MRDATFNSSFEQGNRTMPIVREILGLVFFKVANSDDDIHRNTDLIFDSALGKLRISVRIRTHKEYSPLFKYQFTLCCGRDSGVDAEYQKIMHDGYGDYIVYGFENETGESLCSWFVGDLSVFRKWAKTGKWTFNRDSKKDDPKLGALKRDGHKVGSVEKVPRTDWKTGETYYDYFYAYDRRLVSGNFVIAYYDNEKEGD